MTKFLINFSIYDYELQKYGGSWARVTDMLRRTGLDGLEVLTNYEPVPLGIPKDLTMSVHLPSALGWLGVWNDDTHEIPMEIPDESVPYFYGGRKKEDIIENFCAAIRYASVLEPAYGVYHASYIALHDVYSHVRSHTDAEVLDATADFLNECVSRFPGGEPPFDICIENLWHPGLTYLNSGDVSRFIDRLAFKKWSLLLDTGHLMNAIGTCTSEEGAIDAVLACIDTLDQEIIDRIQSVHLHQSTSGSAAENLKEPENYQTMSFEEKVSCLYPQLSDIDQHRPFTLPACREILDVLSPEFVVHEFCTTPSSAIEEYILTQMRALGLSAAGGPVDR